MENKKYCSVCGAEHDNILDICDLCSIGMNATATTMAAAIIKKR